MKAVIRLIVELIHQNNERFAASLLALDFSLKEGYQLKFLNRIITAFGHKIFHLLKEIS